jgi:hypothetical protein
MGDLVDQHVRFTKPGKMGRLMTYEMALVT